MKKSKRVRIFSLEVRLRWVVFSWLCKREKVDIFKHTRNTL
jgi:hypothetical protein